ncbi:alpha/beta hydrolase [Candidatus Albibeggiatoa sp. nov. NOAA]|uniref:alpha/beta fold hydrolase n=1 Tax=Candidatus Albibeggiatoa sp. nov. NOAA TaxID=3162724 RepID=UPI0033048706|nr:alpha/beta hydrolase [Thiotrichaceae bacterium]
MQHWWQQQFPKGCQFAQIEDANQQMVNIAYGEKGQGKTLILLHGWGLWSYAWHKNIDPLAEHFRVICLDFKGSGFSDKPAKPEIVGHQIIETINFIKQVSDEPVILLGESLGGLVALGVAEQAPELIDQLIVVDAAIFPKKMPNLGMYLLGIMPLGLVRFADRLRLARLFYPVIYYVVKMSHAQTHHKIPVEKLKKAIQQNIYPYYHFPNAITKLIEDTKIGINELLKQERGEPNFLTEVQQKLETIQCPTLILWGEKDIWFPVAHAERLHSILPDSQLTVLPDCGHHATSDASETVNQAVIEFGTQVEKS